LVVFQLEHKTPIEIHLISESKLKNVSRTGGLKTDAPAVSSSWEKWQP